MYMTQHVNVLYNNVEVHQLWCVLFLKHVIFFYDFTTDQKSLQCKLDSNTLVVTTVHVEVCSIT